MTGRDGHPLGIVQEIEIWPYEQVVYIQPGISPGEWDAQTSLGFEIETDHLISARRPDLVKVLLNGLEDL